MSALDSDQLISRALKKLGNETITTEAQFWLANILDRLYEDFKWPFLEKLSTGNLTAGQSSVTLPVDFQEPWDDDSFIVIDSSGAQHPLEFFTQYDLDLVTRPGTLGRPDTALIDLNAMTWRPYPLPQNPLSYQIRYKYKPNREADPTDTFTPAFPNDQILIQAIYVDGLQFEDDDRYVPEMKVLEGMITRYKSKFNKAPNKKQQNRFSRRFATPQSYR